MSEGALYQTSMRRFFLPPGALTSRFVPTRIVSGGQTGADRGALEAAEESGVPTGGWLPRGLLTEDGVGPELVRRFGLCEMPGLAMAPARAYAQRTRANVRDSDATLIVGDVASPGSALTRRAAEAEGRPCLVVAWRPGHTQPSPDAARRWLAEHRPLTLNVAGNRESRAPGIGAVTRALVACLLN
jgi:hypothetical protein